MCTGWHVGWAYGILLLYLNFYISNFIFLCVAIPFASSAICFLFDRILKMIMSLEEFYERSERKKNRRIFRKFNRNP